jgi:glycosyltransferase involved in cell wall biosynthesis
MRILTCNSPYGRGGLGQHFAQLVEESRREDMLGAYYTPTPRAADGKGVQVPRRQWHDLLVQYTPLRWSLSWQTFLYNEFFDRRVASLLNGTGTSLMGFSGECLHCLNCAERLGFETLELVSPTSHVSNVERQHAKSMNRQGLRGTWLNARIKRKMLQEYERAHVIYVHTEYTRRSFLEAGVPAAKLSRTYLHVHPRFQPPTVRPRDDTFHIVYVGRVDVTKGIPLLLEAYARLPINNKKLTLIGGWSTRSMRKYMGQWLTRDLNLRVAPGDPLGTLQKADVLVHPTYEDGFGYAPMEALACGLPVIATRDTGMNEYIRDEKNGYVVPTGDRDAIIDRLMDLYRTPLATTRSLLPDHYWSERDAVPGLSDIDFNA